ncbi:MAG: hypothetical protein Satyrvirus28_15 [Satyrvirus sp.]|uniref:LysM domain-containing protein n=1 Tax=Satyrvirus sp. TaxID=2487771 RepID=A0A3G5AEQ8_9VIRU|nr:MAG: hypothetical protein Satyrvirus28_15 [Satyrvirus sp.]
MIKSVWKKDYPHRFYTVVRGDSFSELCSYNNEALNDLIYDNPAFKDLMFSPGNMIKVTKRICKCISTI